MLQIKKVCVKEVTPISEGTLKGCMIPFDANQIIPGQLVQVAESYTEGERIGSGRIPVNPMMFVAVHGEGVHVKCANLYRTLDEQSTDFYMHTFTI